ncbi:MAG: hypothetical protein R3A45_02680 [Bdellovibrionota bacterium]
MTDKEAWWCLFKLVMYSSSKARSICLQKLYEEMQNADSMGISVGDVSLDMSKTQAWKKC